MFAIIAAGGSGTRMGCSEGRNKILLPLFCGKSILQCAIENILAAGVCRGLCVVTRAEDVMPVQEEIRQLHLDLETMVVLGGATRAESVRNGLEAIRGRAQFVLIHDAARPLCAPELIRAVVERARIKHAALLAIPVSATLKRSADNKEVLGTVPREGMWEAQTPQVFEYNLLDEAYAAAGEGALRASDDSQIVERFGHAVALVMGSPRNIKITTSEDLAIARVLLSICS